MAIPDRLKPKQTGDGMADDVGYYERRLQQERTAAAVATSDDVRLLHEELAVLYSKMIGILKETGEPV